LPILHLLKDKKNQAQTYFGLKDTKLAKSGAKGQKYNSVYAILSFFPSLHNDFVNFVSFKRKYVLARIFWFVFISLYLIYPHACQV
jgi:hypothetical protein